MPSKIYNSLLSRANKAKGGKGLKAVKTKVIRVPENHLEELDYLLQDYKSRSLQNPKSPRYHFLNQFISELEEILVGSVD